MTIIAWLLIGLLIITTITNGLNLLEQVLRLFIKDEEETGDNK